MTALVMVLVGVVAILAVLVVVGLVLLLRTLRPLKSQAHPPRSAVAPILEPRARMSAIRERSVPY
jgi:hypothetical protein